MMTGPIHTPSVRRTCRYGPPLPCKFHADAAPDSLYNLTLTSMNDDRPSPRAVPDVVRGEAAGRPAGLTPPRPARRSDPWAECYARLERLERNLNYLLTKLPKK